MAEKKRYCYVDAIKVLAIFFVCSYHFWNGGNYDYVEPMENYRYFYRFVAGIFSTCVPLFLVANGAVLLNRPFDAKKHYTSLLKMLVQYWVWWNLIALIFGLCIGYDFSSLTVQQRINHFLLFHYFEDINLVYLWFIQMLCCIHLLFPLYKKVFDDEHEDKNSRIVLLVLMGVLVFFNFCSEDFPIYRTLSPHTAAIDVTSLEYFDPFHFMTGTMSLYFLLGGFLHKYREKLQKTPWWLCLLLILVGMVVLLISWYIASTRWGYSYDNVFGSYDSTPTLLCVIGISILMLKAEPLLQKFRPISSLISCIGRNTLSIYYTHWIVGHFLQPQRYIHGGVIGNFVKAAIFVACGVAFGEIVKRIPVLRTLVK